MAGMYPDNEELTIFGEKVQWPGVDASGKFTNGSFTDPLEKPSFIPAETLNLILDNLSTFITKLGGTPDNTSATQLAELFTPMAGARRGIMRDAAGRAQVAAPQAAADIARKADVDTAVRFMSGYGVCATENANTGKVVTVEGAELIAGRRICVKFMHGNTASEPTLNVNNLGAKPITMDGLPVYTGCFDAGGVYEFVYDGTNWECLSGVVRARSFGENTGYVKYRNGLLMQVMEDTRNVSMSQWDSIAGTLHYPIAFTQTPFVVSSCKGGGGCVLYVSDNGLTKESITYGVSFVAYSGGFSGARFLLVGF